MTSSVMLLGVIMIIVCVLNYIGCERDDKEEGQKNQRQAVLEELLKKRKTNGTTYDSTIAPNFEDDIPTQVYIQIYVQHIYAVSESSMDFSVDLILRQRWMDTRLEYLNMSIKLPFLELDNKLMESVWVPDTYFVNEKSGVFHMITQPNKMMHLYKNGTVLYSMRLSLTLSCPMNLRKYPLDEQKCPLILQSYAYTDGNVKFNWDYLTGKAMQIQPRVIMPQFEPSEGEITVTCKNGYRTSDEENRGMASFSCLQTEIYLRRKVGYYIVQVFIPSILIVVLSWVSFWVDHDAVPARISLGVLTVLTMTTQSSGARQSLPQVSYIKAIDVWMFTCLLFVFIALLEYSYVNVVARRHKKLTDKPSSRDSSEIHTAMTQKETILQQESGALLTGERVGNLICCIDLDGRRVDKYSRRVFPGLFILFNIVFWTVYSLIPNPDPE